MMNYLLALIVHHIIFDAWSHGVFLNEMATLYNAAKAGADSLAAAARHRVCRLCGLATRLVW